MKRSVGLLFVPIDGANGKVSGPFKGICLLFFQKSNRMPFRVHPLTLYTHSGGEGGYMVDGYEMGDYE